MYNKQLKIINKANVESFMFTDDTAPTDGGVMSLRHIKASTAKAMVQAVPSKLPPYNYYNPDDSNVLVKNTGVSEVFKKMMGASNNKTAQNVEQYTGILDISDLKTKLPCIASVFMYMLNGEVMISGKFISCTEGRRYMYAIINRLTKMQQYENSKPNTPSKQYVGIIKGRAFTSQNEYELICDFIVSFEALKLLETEKFGFIVNTKALKKFDYALAGIEAVKPSDKDRKEFLTWASKHNDAVISVLNKKT